MLIVDIVLPAKFLAYGSGTTAKISNFIFSIEDLNLLEAIEVIQLYSIR